VNTIVVQYRPRPDAVDANQALIEDVFAELTAKRPDGLRYLSLRLDDGTFVHIAQTDGDTNPLLALGSFRAFSSTVDQRCDTNDGPRAQPAHIVGHYRAFD
jgi:hypothetical protein